MLNTDSARTILERMTMSGAAAGDYRPDIIMADNIIGGALLQVAANPKLAGGAVYSHMHTFSLNLRLDRGNYVLLNGC